VGTVVEVVVTLVLAAASVAAIAHFGRFIVAEPLKKKKKGEGDDDDGDGGGRVVVPGPRS
jgi:hypothetical protein